MTGLTNGQAYTFTVTAGNRSGVSAASAPSNSVTPVDVPGAPSDVFASAGDGDGFVVWTEPASTGGLPVTSYTVTASPGGRSEICLSSPCVVDGLINGTSYRFTVTASNAHGPSASSTPSNAVVPARAPDAPGVPSATPANAAAVVTFDAPASDGGSPVLLYTVRSNPGGLTSSCSTSPCTVTGLTNGTAYTFTVTATNTAGTSQASAASPVVTPATVASPPTAVTATPAPGSASVAFTQPATDGGKAITGYTVLALPGGRSATCTASPCTVTGLTNGQDYVFVVYATNGVGNSANSAPSPEVTPVASPSAPRAVTASRADTDVTISWTAPADLGGSPVTSYAVSLGGGLTCSPGTATSCVVSGLTLNAAYTASVTATNAAGTGAVATVAVPAALAPDAPRNVTALPTPDDEGVVLLWNPPADNGSAVTSYGVTSTPAGVTCTPVPATEPSCTVPQISSGVAYTFQVTATNAVGTGPQGSSDVYTRTGLPSVPLDLVATPSYRSLALSFAAPLTEGRSPILGYRVSVNGGGSWSELAVSGADGGPYQAAVSGLVPGRTYQVRVQAYNGFGYGGATRPPVSATTRALSVPSVPVNPEYTSSTTSIGVLFHKPFDDGGSPILGYRISLNGGGTWSDLRFTGPASGPYRATVSGLVPGRTYQLRMQADNAQGYGGANRPAVAVTTAG